MHNYIVAMAAAAAAPMLRCDAVAVDVRGARGLVRGVNYRLVHALAAKLHDTHTHTKHKVIMMSAAGCAAHREARPRTRPHYILPTTSHAMLHFGQVHHRHRRFPAI